MHVLERRKYNRVTKEWSYWEEKVFFCEINSANPRLEALQHFEKISHKIGEFWRVVKNGKLVIEQR